MKEVYSNRLFDESKEEEDSYVRGLKYRFNQGNQGDIDLYQIVNHWDFFKEKDISYCLANDPNNGHQITQEILKNFMSKYEDLVSMVEEVTDIGDFIYEYSLLSSEISERQ